jgi:hypothetical protein
MFPWLKSDWTTIIQLRNEIRTPDRIEGKVKPSSGSVLFFIVPQVNYVLLEKWYLSVMVDLPVYQYFVGHSSAEVLVSPAVLPGLLISLLPGTNSAYSQYTVNTIHIELFVFTIHRSALNMR